MSGANIFDQLETRKDTVLKITKDKGIPGQKAQVVVVLDKSGSMESLYNNGTVQTLVERLLPVGMVMDDNESIDFYAFHSQTFKLENVTQSNIRSYVEKRVIPNVGWGGTDYAPAIKQIANECKIVFSTQPAGGGGFLSKMFGNGSPSHELVTTPTTMQYPTLVLFITDGDNSDKPETEMLIRELSKHGIFFQFIGIGNAQFAFLDKLDNLSGRKIDNANFFKVEDINAVTDTTLYNMLLNEFPVWLREAKQHKMIQ